jgi:cell division protein FtsB
MKSRWWIAGLLLLAGSTAVLLHTVLDPDGWTRRQRIEADLEELRAENARLEATVSELRREIKALRTRREVQERVVRDELGFVKPNEVVLELGDEASHRIPPSR